MLGDWSIAVGVMIAANLASPLLAQEVLRVPPPTGEETAEATDLVREVYRPKYVEAESHEQRAELAAFLLQEALDTENDYPGQYVLLDEAYRIAESVGDVNTALDAVRQRERLFEGEVDSESVVLRKCFENARFGSQKAVVASAAVRVARRLMESEEFDEAAEAAEFAVRAAKRVRNGGLAREAERLEGEIVARREAMRDFAVATAILNANPDDPTASRQMGAYQCYVLDAWEEGLAYFARSGDERLVAIAAMEEAIPEKDADILELADAWWDLDESIDHPSKRRAVHWYERLSDDLDGLHRRKADSRIKQFRAESEANKIVDILATIDPARDTIEGRWDLRDGVLVAERGSWIKFRTSTAKNYRISARITHSSTGIHFRLPVDGICATVLLDVYLQGLKGPHTGYVGAIGKWPWPPKVVRGAHLNDGEIREVQIEVRGRKVKIVVEGQVVAEFHDDFDNKSLANTPASIAAQEGTFAIGFGSGTSWMKIHSLTYEPL